MKRDFGSKTWLYPMPVLIIGSYDDQGVANAMNAAWGGISLEEQISICVDDVHKTTANILKQRAFTVHIADAQNLVACDYVGCVSGHHAPDKVARTGWTVTKSRFVNAPIFEELPMVLECELLRYEEADCRLVGKIINVAIEERVLTPTGKVDVAKLDPITYDTINRTYHRLGEIVGKAFHAGQVLSDSSNQNSTE